MELEEVAVAGFSVGRLLMPASWTLDTYSHYVPPSLPLRVRHTSDSDTHATAVGDNSLHTLVDTGTTSNTLRAERLDRSGDTLYLTEVYIPRLVMGSEPDSLLTVSRDGALSSLPSLAPTALLARMQYDALSRVPPRRKDRPPLQVWVTRLEEEASKAAARSASSITAQLLPTHHIFLQLVLDVAEGPSEGMTTMAQTILQDTVRRLLSPLAELCHRRASSATRGVSTGNATSTIEMHLRTSDRWQQQQQQQVYPLQDSSDDSWWRSPKTVLTGEGEPVFRAGAYSKRGGAVISTLLVPFNISRGGITTAEFKDTASTDERSTDLSSIWGAHWNTGRCQGPSDQSVDVSRSAALRHFAKHKLRLRVSDAVMFSLHERGTPGADQRAVHGFGEVCVATFPLSLSALALTTEPSPVAAPRCSIHSYPSIEEAFERHTRTALAASHRKRATSTSNGHTPPPAAAPALGDDGNGVDEEEETGSWELIKVRSSDRFVPSESFLNAVSAVEEEELALQLASTQMAREHAMPHVPYRYTLYSVRHRYAESTTTPTPTVADLSSTVASPTTLVPPRPLEIVAQLLAPRVQSDAAIVLLATVHEAHADAAETLARCLTMSYPSAREWTSVVRSPTVPTPSAVDAGSFLFRQGQLALRVSVGDRRYCRLRVLPTAALAFSTLGSITILRGSTETTALPLLSKLAGKVIGESSAQPLATPASASSAASLPCRSPPLPPQDPYRSHDAGKCDPVAGNATSVYDTVSATWTLHADGRSAADYLDYILTECYYDTGVFNLGNVAQRTTAPLQKRSTLWVRNRGKNTTHALHMLQKRRAAAGVSGNTAAAAAFAGSSSAGSAVWSAWVDVGESRRVFLCAQERHMGQMLFIQACIDAPRPRLSAASAKDPNARSEEEHAEEAELEAWVFGIAVGTTPRF